MTLTLATACYKRYDLLVQMLASAEAGLRRPDRYYLVDNGGIANPEALPRNMEIHRPGRNIGVAPAVNLIFRENSDLTVWTNDDVIFNRDTLEVLEREALADESRLFVLPQHNPGSAFTVFIARRALFDRVGWFDERFVPAYFEDNDFAYRMQLAGIEKHYAACGYYHHTSATIQSYTTTERAQHDINFRRNEELYRRKWGGAPGQECFREPRE